MTLSLTVRCFKVAFNHSGTRGIFRHRVYTTGTIYFHTHNKTVGGGKYAWRLSSPSLPLCALYWFIVLTTMLVAPLGHTGFPDKYPGQSAHSLLQRSVWTQRLEQLREGRLRRPSGVNQKTEIIPVRANLCRQPVKKTHVTLHCMFPTFWMWANNGPEAEYSTTSSALMAQTVWELSTFETSFKYWKIWKPDGRRTGFSNSTFHSYKSLLLGITIQKQQYQVSWYTAILWARQYTEIYPVSVQWTLKRSKV